MKEESYDCVTTINDNFRKSECVFGINKDVVLKKLLSHLANTLVLDHPNKVVIEIEITNKNLYT